MPAAPPLSALVPAPEAVAPEQVPCARAAASGAAVDMTTGIERAPVVRGGVIGLVAELTKARLTAMVLVTTAVGFVVASPTVIDWPRLALTILGTALAAGSASIVNQVFEVDHDARMRRTRLRPLPSGRIGATAALTLALLLGWAGVMVLGLFTHPLAAGLALLNILLYVFVYTPLKTRTTLNTLIGAVTGAIPPMIGWVAVTGSLDVGAWVLGAILFVWQLPHFLALAWLYRDDYRAGGFIMLPLRDPHGTLTAEVTLMTALMLVPVGLLAFLTGLAGGIFAVGSVVLAGVMVLLAAALARAPGDLAARRVFLASIVYLPLLLGLMVFDRGSVLRSIGPEAPAPTERAVEAAALAPMSEGVGIRP